jgi:flavin reductase (DIM6/NTAB) family NADH-FMN oxidoreductase RutF
VSNDIADLSSISSALSHVTHGVYVLSTRRGRQLAAMTAAWVTQVSEYPPGVGVAVKATNYTHDAILASETFALSILSEEQVDVATHFGSGSSEFEEKFAGVPFQRAPSGSPVLLDCLAYLDCRLINTTRMGDYTIFIGEVTAAETVDDDRRPLIYDPEEYE